MYTQPERITLTYQGATFKRSLISLAIAIAALLCFLFIKFKPDIPPPGAVAGPPLAKIALGMTIAFALIASISDAWFVLDCTFFQKQVDCDEDNLYVIRKKEVTIIPLSSISFVRLTNWGSKGVRGSSSIYVVGYQDSDGRSKELDITLFLKMGKNFDLFEKRVQAKNPTAEIKNWATNIDPIIGFFRKKKDN